MLENEIMMQEKEGAEEGKIDKVWDWIEKKRQQEIKKQQTATTG